MICAMILWNSQPDDHQQNKFNWSRCRPDWSPSCRIFAENYAGTGSAATNRSSDPRACGTSSIKCRGTFLLTKRAASTTTQTSPSAFSNLCDFFYLCGAGDGDRTRDVQLGNRKGLIASIDVIELAGGTTVQNTAKTAKSAAKMCSGDQLAGRKCGKR